MNVVADKAWVLAEPVCTELGLELIDVIYERKGEIWFLIVTVDKPGGIGVDDLSALSVQLDPLLDIE
ncbi:MAG: ribosome maturation factor RimP, partial [Candidatus Coatesbacteria bacterium]|nr:ribosome maturation factor RimP [Candidatus Coatesbacteria bacterium]